MNSDRENLTFTTLGGPSATGGDPHQTFIVEQGVNISPKKMKILQ